jgi:putative tRNA adenosine deaminase-associated protein
LSYFTAVLAREGKTWTTRDLEVEGADDLEELTAELRALVDGDEPVLVLVEREDAWWAVVRVDGDEDPRVFVSDLAGAAHSPYAELLDVTGEDDDEEQPPGCGGDLDVLADLGTSPDTLQDMCDDEVLPMDALATVAEAAGFAEVLDSLR